MKLNIFHKFNIFSEIDKQNAYSLEITHYMYLVLRIFGWKSGQKEDFLSKK